MRRPSGWGWVVTALVLAIAVTGGRYYHREANIRLRAEPPRALNDRSDVVAAFMERLPASDNHLTRDTRAPATQAETASLLRLYHLLNLDAQQRRLLFALVDSGRPEWGIDTVMRHMRSTMASRLLLELERGRFETVRLYGQRFINLVDAMPPNEHFLGLDEALRTARRVVQVITHRYLYDDETVSRDVLRALIGGATTIASARVEAGEPWLRDEVAYANARARTAGAKRYAERRTIWEEFLSNNPQSRRRLEAAFNVLDATMNAYRDMPGGAPERLTRARALSREALALAQDFIRSFPDSYLTDDALRYALRLAFSLQERDEMVTAYLRLARTAERSDAFKRTQYGLAQWVIVRDKASPGEGYEAAAWLAEQARRPPAARVSIAGDSSAPARLARLLGEAEPQALTTTESREVVARVLSAWLNDRHAEEGVRTSWDPPKR